MNLSFSIFENVQQAKSYLKDNNIPETDWAYLEIRKLLKGKDGYVGWLTKITYNDIIPNSNNNKNTVINELTNIVDILTNKKYLMDIMPKKVIEYDTYESFIDDYQRSIINYKAKKMYEQFPSTQKNLIDLKNKNVASLLSKLFDDEQNVIFLKKISAYKDKNELLQSIKNFLNKKNETSFDKILSDLHKQGVELTYVDETNNIIIVKVLNYKQCSNIGRRTSWCIVRSESTYQSYLRDLGIQYIILLTDKNSSDNDSIIGVTFNINGYVTAHAKNDSHISLNTLKKILSDRGFDINNLKVKKESLTQHDIDMNPVVSLKKAGFTNEEIIKNKKIYKPDDLKVFTKEEIDTNNLLDLVELSSNELHKKGYTNEEIAKKKRLFKPSDLSIFTKEEIEKYKLLDKSELSGRDLDKYTKEEIINKNILDRIEDSTLTYEMLLKVGFNGDEIKRIRDLDSKLAYGQSEFYNKYLNKSKEDFKRFSGYDFRYGSRWSSSGDRYDLGKTIAILRWYNINPEVMSLEQLTGAFEDVSPYNFDDIKKFLDDKGYNLSDDEMVDYLLKISRSSSDAFDKNAKLIEMGYDRWEETFEDLNSNRKPVNDYKLQKITNLLTNGGKTKELEKFLNINERNQFLQDTLATGEHTWNKQRDSLTPNKWFQKWGNYAAGIDWDNVSGWGSYDYDSNVIMSYIIILAVTKNYDHLYNLRVNWDIGKNRNWDGNRIGQIVGIITNTLFTNGHETYKLETELKEEDRRKLYDWLINYVWKQVEDKEYFRYDMQLSYFIFDKTRFYQYVDDVKLLKDNYEYYNRNDKLVRTTIRIVELLPTFNYLTDDKYKDTLYRKTFDNIEEYKKLLTYFLNGIKMLKGEKESTVNSLYKKSYRSSQKDDNEKINNVIKSLIDITDIKLRESLITSYQTFIK